jgi:uncharacterized membrane protein YcaP (DUF421 family)
MDLRQLLGPGFNPDLFLKPAVGLIEITVRTLVVYVVLVVGIRLVSKRPLGLATPFDFVLVLTLSNAVQNAMTGGDNSLTGGIVSAFVLLGSDWAFNRTVFRLKPFKRWLIGQDILLVHDGRQIHSNLRRAGVDEDELRRRALESNFRSLSEVGEAIYEVDGTIVFFPKTAVSRASVPADADNAGSATT